jgi:membrane-associated PAP2 superfamily phosphatase
LGLRLRFVKFAKTASSPSSRHGGTKHFRGLISTVHGKHETCACFPAHYHSTRVYCRLSLQPAVGAKAKNHLSHQPPVATRVMVDRNWL